MMMGQGRSKRRYTEDGRLCASAFAQDGQTFFDCTSTKSPDGQNKNREWCYVDASQKGDKPWSYCNPIMDYDKIREHNQNILKDFTVKARKVNEEVEKSINPGEQALSQMRKTKQGLAELDMKINTQTKELETMNNNMQSLYNTKDQWEIEEKKATEIAALIQLRRQKEKELNSSKKPIEMDKTDDTIKKETETYKLTVSPFIQERWLSNEYNCDGLLHYEEEPDGDGLTGYYFDNASFLGEYKEQKDYEMEFNWTGSSPADGINAENFSARWEGYLYIPVAANYKFSIECDDGASLTLNNQIIISHNMFTATRESKQRVDKWLKQEVDKIKNVSKNHQKSTSKDVKLIGGTKYKIVVSYFHSVHNDVYDSDRAFFKLTWESNEFDERPIPKGYFYTENAYPPLKLTGITSETAVLRKLYENDLAFKNNEYYILKDIPQDYSGLSTLKFNLKYLGKELSFISNIPVIVYMGRLMHYPNHIPDDFEDLGQFMTLLKVNKPAQNGSKRISGDRSGLVKIFKKKFEAGKIVIPLNTKGINIKGIPIIIFFGFDSQLSSPISCGGNELWISNPTSKYYKGCTESSSFNNKWKCKDGLSGQNKDKEGGMWASKREGVGSWLNVEFRDIFEITKIQYVNRKNPSERNSLILATFSSGEEFQLKLGNVDKLQEIAIYPPIRATSVKFTIKEVYGTINNGGSFKVFGVKCIDPDQEQEVSKQAHGLEAVTAVNPKALKPLFDIKDNKAVPLSCRDSLSNSKKLDHVKQKPGSSVIVKCSESCALTNVSIYGDLKYSKDSSICRAAYHSSKLKATGGLVKLVFGLGLSSYKSATRNSIKSKNKGKSDITISFEEFDDKDDIILQNGSKIDFRKNGKWLPGIISKIIENKNGKSITVTFENSEPNVQPIEASYPDKKIIKACGDRVKNRDCKGSRNNPNTNRPIKIKFAPSTYNTPGDYLFDKGETFGTNGRAYGWTSDMSNRIKLRLNPSKKEMDTLVEFPPSPKSKFCNTSNPEVLCDKVSWSVKAGFGRFNVKIYVGDPAANTRLDLKVNNEYIVRDTTLTKNELKIYEGSYEAINQFITISSECETDCEYAMSKMNMIEISPFEEGDDDSKEDATKEEADPCGNAISGGRCDTGPDATHCLFENPTAEGGKFCTGELIMMQVPKTYRCVTQRNKYKCVKRDYNDQSLCVINCPGTCQAGKCL